jgi:hypothetical protein
MVMVLLLFWWRIVHQYHDFSTIAGSLTADSLRAKLYLQTDEKQELARLREKPIQMLRKGNAVKNNGFQTGHF